MKLRALVLLVLTVAAYTAEADPKQTTENDRVFYKGRWVTQEHKEKLEQGLVLYKGTWMPEEEMWKAKGYVKHLGTWISPTRLKSIQKRQEMARERIKFASDWNNAWKYKTPQGNFIITSNVSPEMVKEIGTAMEVCYAELSKVLGVKKATKNFSVEVYATPQQFMEHSAKAGIPVGRGVLGYFYWGGSEMGIRAFYAGSADQTLNTLFHECTHLVVRQVCGDVPTWANEGLAVFFESARRTDRKMELETIPFGRLWNLRDQLKEGDISLTHLTKLNGAGQYSGRYYPQGWSLIYYLLYAEKGKYRKNFAAFYNSMMNGRYDGDSVATFKRHFGKEPDEFGSKWKDFVSEIEPKNLEELVDAATTAFTDYVNFDTAHRYATQALEQMKGEDTAVLLCNARMHLMQSRFKNAPEEKAKHADKSVEFFNRALPGYADDGKKPKSSRRADASYARDRLDYARACVGAGEYERAQDLVEDVLTRKEFEFNADGYSVLAYIAVKSTDPAFYSLEIAKENASLAEDLGADHQNTYVQALIAMAENDPSRAAKLLSEASSQDEYGALGKFYSQELIRLARGKNRN